jgi:hypothetical protein
VSKKEIVFLASRLFALIQMVTAALEASYLPERILDLHYHADRISRLGPSAYDNHWQSYYQISVALLIGRIAILLVLAVVFWNPAPWVERIFQRKPESEDPAV